MKQDGDQIGFKHTVRREGASAYWDDIKLKDNPYRRGGSNHQQWKLGWRQAEMEVTKGFTDENDCDNAKPKREDQSE